jgi:hypothetical protein
MADFVIAGTMVRNGLDALMLGAGDICAYIKRSFARSGFCRAFEECS